MLHLIHNKIVDLKPKTRTRVEAQAEPTEALLALLSTTYRYILSIPSSYIYLSHCHLFVYCLFPALTFSSVPSSTLCSSDINYFTGVSDLVKDYLTRRVQGSSDILPTERSNRLDDTSSSTSSTTPSLASSSSVPPSSSPASLIGKIPRKAEVMGDADGHGVNRPTSSKLHGVEEGISKQPLVVDDDDLEIDDDSDVDPTDLEYHHNGVDGTTKGKPKSSKLQNLLTRVQEIKRAHDAAIAAGREDPISQSTKRWLVTRMYVETAKSKAKFVVQFVDDLVAAGAKFLVFAHHRFVLDAVEDFLSRSKVCTVSIPPFHQTEQSTTMCDLGISRFICPQTKSLESDEDT